MNAKFLRYLDKLAGFFIYAVLPPFGAFVRKKKFERKILVIKLWAIGETILALPAIKELKRLYRGYKIIALCTNYNRAVFDRCKYVDGVISFSPFGILKALESARKENFEIVVDFEPYTKISSAVAFLSGAKTRVGFSSRKLLYTRFAEPERIHAVKNFVNLAKLLGNVKYPKELVKLSLDAKDRKAGLEILRKNGIGKGGLKIGVHAGLGYSSAIRKWPGKKFALLCDKLAEKYGAKIVFVGSEKDRRLNESIISLMKFKTAEIYENVPTLAAVMENLDLFIANDSGPMHLAAAMGVPTIGLFGPNMPELYGPYGSRNIGIYKGPGEPYIRPFDGSFPESYRKEYDTDMIEVEDVMGAASRFLKRGSIRP